MSGYRILVVDDSRTVRRMIGKTIGLAGIPVAAVDYAENGQQALECLEAQEFDLLMTDINMPVMDGMELVRIMAERRLIHALPVVVISTEGSDERIRTLRRYGIRGFLRKPVTPEGIRTIMESVLEGRTHA